MLRDLVPETSTCARLSPVSSGMQYGPQGYACRGGHIERVLGACLWNLYARMAFVQQRILHAVHLITHNE